MHDNKRISLLCISALLLSAPVALGAKKPDKSEGATAEITTGRTAVLWRDPTDIGTRNMFFGPGGEEHAPRGAFTFVKEDLDGTTPKFFVRGEDGVKWKVKLGSEARPETVASRFTWAAGYFANEDYFLANLTVRNLPARLHRGEKYVSSDGALHNVRLKRYVDGEEKTGNWQWKDFPLHEPREFNGLRVLMALLNNWDLTDENTAIYDEPADGVAGSPNQILMVSDLGSTFGEGRLTWPLRKSRGNVQSYRLSPFITHVTADSVDFHSPARASLFFLATPHEFAHKWRLRWIGKHIPRADARWMGQLLAQLSPEQIRDAFRAAGYSPEQVESFAQVVESRIAELGRL